MFRLDEGLKVYLHREPIDFRLNINGRRAKWRCDNARQMVSMPTPDESKPCDAP